MDDTMIQWESAVKTFSVEHVMILLNNTEYSLLSNKVCCWLLKNRRVSPVYIQIIGFPNVACITAIITTNV